jgi:hypothetical protein
MDYSRWLLQAETCSSLLYQIIIVKFEGLFSFLIIIVMTIIIIIVVISPVLAVEYKDKEEEPHDNECSG